MATKIDFNGEQRKEKLLYYKTDKVDQVIVKGDEMVIKLKDKDEEYKMHSDYFECVLSDKPLDGFGFRSGMANVLVRPFKELLRKYDYPLSGLKDFWYVLEQQLKLQEEEAYKKIFGKETIDITLNDYEKLAKDE